MTTQLVNTDGTPIEHGFEVLLTPKDAAQILCVGVRTLNNYARDGKVRFTTTAGGHRRYYADSIRAVYEGRYEDAAQKGPQEDMHVCDVVLVAE